MKRPYSPRKPTGARILAPVLALVLFACTISPGTPPGKGAAVLSVRIDYASQPARVLLPAFDMKPADFQITCSGPGGRELGATVSGSSTRFEELEPGSWTVAVTARNEAGAAVGTGTAEVQVEPVVETTVTVTVFPLGGEGSLELELSWPPGVAALPSLEGELIGPSGESFALAFTIEGSQATASKAALPAGYYTLAVRLFDAGEQVTGLAEAVRIVSGQTTSGTLEFAELTGSPGSIDARLLVDLCDPVEVEIAGRQTRMGLGDSLALKAWPAEEGRELEGAWYVDGSFAANEPSVSLGSALGVGMHRIDLLAREPGRQSAGSAFFLAEVLSEFPVGSLAYSTRFVDGVAGIDGLGACRSVAVSPDGRSVYVAGYGESAIARFERDTETGMLRYRGISKEGDGSVAGIAGVDPLRVSPDGAYLFAGGSTGGTVALFRRDGESGALTFLGSRSSTEPGLEGLAGIRSFALSPDGSSLYAAGYTLGTILTFSFDAASGELTLVQALSDEAAGLTLLGGASSVAVTPDGAQVIVTSFDDDSLLVFDRDEASGALTTAQSFTDGVSGCEGLNGATCVAVSQEAVYVAGYYDNTLSVFSRDPSDGSLSLTAELKDGIAGVDGLYHAQDIALSSDGNSLYVAASADDGVSFFERSSAGLTYRGLVGEMEGARGLALSSDGRNCYAAASGANTLFLLNRRR